MIFALSLSDSEDTHLAKVPIQVYFKHHLVLHLFASNEFEESRAFGCPIACGCHTLRFKILPHGFRLASPVIGVRVEYEGTFVGKSAIKNERKDQKSGNGRPLLSPRCYLVVAMDDRYHFFGLFSRV